MSENVRFGQMLDVLIRLCFGKYGVEEVWLTSNENPRNYLPLKRHVGAFSMVERQIIHNRTDYGAGLLSCHLAS
jgi:hypothetical protein